MNNALFLKTSLFSLGKPKNIQHIKDHDFTTIMDLCLIFWPLFVTPLAFFGFDLMLVKLVNRIKGRHYMP